MNELDPSRSTDGERVPLPSDRLPFSRVLWFVAFVALLTQPWSEATGCNGETRIATGFQLVAKGGLFIPLFLFAFAMLAPPIARLASSRNLRQAVEAMSFTSALFALPLVAVLPRFEILGKRVTLWAADAALAIVAVGLVDTLLRLIQNARHRAEPPPRIVIEPPRPGTAFVLPTPPTRHEAPREPVRVDRPASGTRG